MAGDASPARDAAPSPAPSAAPRPQLSLFDSTCIIVGIIIGAGIYESSTLVAGCMGGAAGTLLIWLAGGLLALCGALCYAELASAWPRAGGDYIYLTRAYGRGTGFLFGWTQLLIVRPADIALLAFVFARYALSLSDPFGGDPRPYAAGAVAILTLLNVLGVRAGARTQNVLTVVKAAGLVALVVAGFLAPGPVAAPAAGSGGPSWGGLQFALILVLFTYGGWSEMAYVAAEVRDARRNILRALLLGTGAVIALYLLVNGAFLHALGYAGMASSKAVAVDTAAALLPDAAGRLIAALVCVSALGAVNGLVLTGARITYALGADHAVFGALGRWDAQQGTPIRALALQGAISLAIVLVAGSFVKTLLYTAPVYWLFALASGLSVFVLRVREPGTPRPVRAPGYPVTPVLFALVCAFMIYSCVTYAWNVMPNSLAVLGGVLGVGIVVYGVTAVVGRTGRTAEYE
jgi:APA family basic amino acid/polyamine antiporter